MTAYTCQTLNGKETYSSLLTPTPGHMPSKIHLKLEHKEHKSTTNQIQNTP